MVLEKPDTEVKYRVDKILETCHSDIDHDTKRLVAFNMLDALLDYCIEDKVCPPYLEKCERFLIDISVAKYIELRAYYYSHDGIGTDDHDRYLMAENKIRNILNCGQACTISEQAFHKHQSSIKNNRVVAQGIRNRKAYWSYLTHDPYNNPVTDYEGACGIVESIHAQLKNPDTQDVAKVNSMNEFLCENMHLINGYELFLMCYLKRLQNASA
jgi:hypothetical protein